MENKNIDRLFQEKLRELEVAPNPKVWNAIHSKLKKRKRRVLPMWWLYSGIAAILVLGLLLFPFSEVKTIEIFPENQDILTTTPKEKKNSSKVKEEKFQETTPINIIKGSVVASGNKSLEKQKKKLKATKKSEEFIANYIAPKEELKTPLKQTVETDKISSEEYSITRTIVPEKSNKIDTASTTTKDSINIKIVSKKDFITLTNVEEKVKTQNNSPKWNITPVFAILNSNSFSNSSPIDSGLSNSTQGNNSFSYGLQLAYQLNKKWSVRSGVHLQELSYSNNQIAILTSSSGNTSNASFDTGDVFSFINLTNAALNLDTNSLTNLLSGNGNVVQKYGYVEIPLEVNYTMSETKKISTHIIAGFSSLFLNKNEIRLNTNTLSRTGEANNLNSINFSGNLGFALDFNFNKNWKMNINPMFKTQLNTFSKNANGFKPYFIGIYTGVKYQF
jgi:hypothetical protein